VQARLAIDGAEQAARSLGELGERFNRDLSPLLAAVAADWTTLFQRNIREGGRGANWPDLHPATKAIRRYYGHGEGPPLIRSGDLLHSIGLLESTPTSIEVGTTQRGSGGVPAARILQSGGTVVDERGHIREVPPFPFIFLEAQDVDDTVELIATYLFGEGAVRA
jgi:phage gpG-like protein